MQIKAKFVSVAAGFLLCGAPLACAAQQVEVSPDSFVSQSVAETGKLNSQTIGEWAILHPGEKVETPVDKDKNYDPGSTRQEQERELQGRWCLRSTAQIPLSDGAKVRRIALFYQPLVEQIYDRPLPPLPIESGDRLRRQGCRLGKIFYEFENVPEPRHFAQTMQIPGKSTEDPGDFIGNNQGTRYWKPVSSFSNHNFFHVFIHEAVAGSKSATAAEEGSGVLLEWEGTTRGSLEYGQQSTKAVNPEAGQPWLPLRIAMLAQQPEGPTFAMLSFLAPQQGEEWEQPPFYCHRQLIPVLRQWMALAARSKPEQRAAAILLADQVLGRLSECAEFAEVPYNSAFESEDATQSTHDALEKDLSELGIKTGKSARPGPEYYAGNLKAQVLKLAPTGKVNELYGMAILDERCQWSQISGANCDELIKEGESLLSRFPEDEWTPSVHLILAEAYSITAADEGGDDAGTADLLKKAAAHFRAWYAKSTNDRDRALVWEEIWAIDAGMGPWLMAPDQLRH
jgi:hypothetical protein